MTPPLVGIVDYGLGNLRSVHNALEMAGAAVSICRTPAELDEVERIVLPGVGAFRDCVAALHGRGFWAALNKAVRRQSKPFLGICLGMQALARRGFEGGKYAGLGWIDADVVRLQPNDPALRVPHVGWNEITYRPGSPLFAGLPPAPDFYFVHSYHLQCADPTVIVATCEYGGAVTAAVCQGNILATQFHPEKSQDYGLQVLKNFVSWQP